MAKERYQLLDSTLSRYDHAIAELRVGEGERAHLACVVMRQLNGDPWPWFVVVWPDGRKELPDEDYGPEWWTVREWDAGHFTYWGEPSLIGRKRFFGSHSVHDSPEITYDVTWLAPDAAAARWHRLGLTDSDF